MEPKKLTNSRADRLAALRDKLSKTDLKGGGGGGFFSPPDGRSIIRILPEVGTMGFFYQQVGTHVLPGMDNKKQFYCPHYTSEGELGCPICDFVEDLKKAGDKASLALAANLRVKRKFWMNVIDRDRESVGPQIFTPGVMVFGQISSLVSDPDYGDIYDIDKGIDLIIERKGKGLETEYQVKPRRGNSSPLSPDEDVVNEWLSKARDLTPVEVSDDPEQDKELSKGHAVYVLPYDRLQREFENAEGNDESDEEEEEEQLPRRKSTTVAAPARRTSVPAAPAKPIVKSRRVVEEEEEEEEYEEEDVDDAQEEEDEVKAEVVQRTARRSLRH